MDLITLIAKLLNVGNGKKGGKMGVASVTSGSP